MSEKRFYWIKLKTNFFSLDEIDFLLSQKNGCEYVVLYQMLCLNTANTNGTLEKRIGEMIVPYDIDKIVRDTKYFDYDTVAVALELYKKLGLIYEDKNSCLTIANFSEMVGSETSGAKRIREWRKKQELLENNNVQEVKKAPKSNAIRQKQHRAKKNCEQKQHIPYIEDYINNKRYNGNYYVVIQRDKYKCAICGSIENLCVHHIDGYDENKPQNNETNKMITLCRGCHSNIHAGKKIDEDILNSIDYYIDSNETLHRNNNVIGDVTQEYRDKSIEYRDIENKEKNKEKDIIVQNDLENRIEPSIIQLILNDKTLYDVTQNDFNEYEELYPNVDVMQELRKMKGWLNANPTKRKTKRGIKRFINNWLSREQDKPKPNNVRKEPTPKWLDKEKNEDESKPEFSTKELIKIYDVQVKCGQTELAEQTSNKYKDLTGKSIEEYKKSKEELIQLMEQIDL